MLIDDLIIFFAVFLLCVPFTATVFFVIVWFVDSYLARKHTKRDKL